LFRRRRAAAAAKSKGKAKGKAEGGYLSGPELIYAGEAGSEYIVPSGKVQQFSRNILGGMRGQAAIPRRFAEGGFVQGNANINITTGPVTQMDGQNFVTTKDMSSAVQAGVNQTLALLSDDMQLRQQLGMA